jgi:hypothetical protein
MNAYLNNRFLKKSNTPNMLLTFQAVTNFFWQKILLLVVCTLFLPTQGSSQIEELAPPTKEEKASLLLFETGQYLLASGYFSEASSYLKPSLQGFPHPEVHHLLGLTSLLESLDYFPSDSVSFVLPLPIDGPSCPVDYSESNRSLRDSLLFAAGVHFRQALQLDPTLSGSRLSLGCTHALLALSGLGKKEWETIHFGFARSYMLQCKKTARMEEDSLLAAQAEVLFGIIQQIKGNQESAAASFRSALPLTAAKINLDLLHQEAAHHRPNRKKDSTTPQTPSLQRMFKLDPTYKASLGMDSEWSSWEQSESVVIQHRSERHHIWIHRSTPTEVQNQSQAQEKFGQPDRQIQLSWQTIWIYDRSRFLLIFKEDSQLQYRVDLN